MMDIVSRGDVFRGEASGPYASSMFAGITPLSEDRWLCTWRAAPTKNTTGGCVLMSVTEDGGQTWSDPLEPWSPPVWQNREGVLRGGFVTDLGNAGLLACVLWVDHSDPDAPFFREEDESLLDCRIFLSRSHDGGSSWTELEYMDTYPIEQAVPLTGPILVLGNGDLACQFELNKVRGTTGTWRHASMLALSPDGGATWPLYSVASNDPENRYFWWDQRPNVLADGTLIDFFWSYDSQEACYTNIMARESLDEGRSWSPLWDTGLPDQPGTPVSLQDGRLSLVYVDRTSAPTIKLRLSEDRGRTWPGDTETVVYAGEQSQTWSDKGTMGDTWDEMGEFSVGLPHCDLTPDGDLLVVYYAGPRTDETGIEWVRLRPR